MKKLWSIVLLLMVFTVASRSWAAQESAMLRRAGDEEGYLLRQEASGVPLTKDAAYTVRLLSERDEGGSGFDSAMLLSFENANGVKFIFSLGDIAGYDASFKTISFVERDKAEVFLSMSTGGSGGYGSFYVIDFDGRDACIIYDSDKDPLPSHVTGRFTDGYRCVASTHGESGIIAIDLTPRKSLYDNAIVYDPAGGKLLKPVELWGGSYGSMAPTKPRGDGTSALRGTVAFSGLFNADRILSVTITQTYEKGRWRPLLYDIKPWNDLKTM